MKSRVDHRLARARQALEQGRRAECERMSREMLAAGSHGLQAQALLARVKLCRWAALRASRQLASAVERDPGSVRTLLMLSFAHARGEEAEAALAWAGKAADLDPSSFETVLWCAQCCLAARRPAEAEDRFRRAIALDPLNAAARHGLGVCLAEQGRMREACESLREAVTLEPGSPKLRIDLIEALTTQADGSEAVEEARRLALDLPHESISHILLAQSLAGDGKPELAEPAAIRAIEIAPDDAVAHAALGSILIARGDLEASRESCLRSLELDPRQGLSYFNLIRSHKATEQDRPMLERMAGRVDDAYLASVQRGLLAYGLGKGFEDLGDYERAMGYYDEANRIEYARKFGDSPFDGEANLALYEQARRRPIQPLSKAGGPPVTPIFVFGMIRSGTTLLEQILSSHPEVGGAGEVPYWPRHKSAGDPAKYLEMLAQAAPGRRFVVDKMPTNYMVADLLHAAFPTAPMLHVRRNPLDTCLSIYTTHNRIPIPWSHAKGNIALNYERYQDLMSFWKSALPERRITEVRYEDLVSSPRPAIEAILSACGLEWSEACLSPERTPRSVSTPSRIQVRQPINTNSVERWRRFEPWLGEWAGLRERSCV